MAYGGEVVEQGSGAVQAAEEGSQPAGPAPRRAPIGPAMPSHAMLMQAQQAAAEYAEQVPSIPPLACTFAVDFTLGLLLSENRCLPATVCLFLLSYLLQTVVCQLLSCR